MGQIPLSSYCHAIAIKALECARYADSKASRRKYIDLARRWNADALFCGWKLP